MSSERSSELNAALDRLARADEWDYYPACLAVFHLIIAREKAEGLKSDN